MQNAAVVMEVQGRDQISISKQATRRALALNILLDAFQWIRVCQYPSVFESGKSSALSNEVNYDPTRDQQNGQGNQVHTFVTIQSSCCFPEPTGSGRHFFRSWNFPLVGLSQEL